MLTIKLSIVIACCMWQLVAELTAPTTSKPPNLNSTELKLKLHEFMNYSFDDSNFQDMENNYEYYRCGSKGIKAFNGTPHFTSSRTKVICTPLHNLEFNNYKNKCGMGNGDLIKSPWIVSVMIRNFFGNETPIYRAAGSIVHPNLILVPHHPFEPFLDKKLMIRSNGETQSLVIDNMTSQTRAVVRSITENFTSTKYQQLKKSLLVLAEPILFNEYAQSICLPQTDDQYEKENCFVVGWKRSNKMLKIRTNLIECNNLERLHGTWVPKEFFVCTHRDVIEPFKNDANYCWDNEICDFSTVLVCPAVGHVNVFYQVGIGYMVANNTGYFLSTIASKLWIDQTVHDLQFKSQYYTRDNNESQTT